MPNEEVQLRFYIADVMEEKACDVVREWIDWLRTRVGTRTVHALPEKAIENHIPAVIKSLSAFIRTPVEAVQSDTIGHLRLHAQIRKQQGYDIQELMVEFDYLAHIINTRMAEAMEGLAAAPAPREVAETFALLNTGLRAMGFVTVGIYRENEEQTNAELSRRLRQYADTLAHEVRQPLQTISMATETLALRAQDDGELMSHVELIRKGLQRTCGLMEDLRMLGAAEEARQEHSWRLLGAIIDDVLEELRPLADDSGVKFVVQPDLPAVELLSLPVQLALLNLVSNAVKYADSDKPESVVKLSAAWTTDAKRTGGCRIQVADNGLGIPAEARGHIFQRHFRAHPQVASGLGLGLSIARHALQQYSGELTVESEEGKGTTFTIAIEGRGARNAGKDSGDEDMHDLLHRSANASLDQLEDGPADGDSQAKP